MIYLLTQKKWEATVNCYRNGNKTVENEELYFEMDYAQYVYGAMSGGGSKKGRLEQKPEMQLCIRKGKMARDITYSLKGAVFILPKE